ncbi:hypothetical protein FRB94_011847 [Tulasnella sp. JGI-2019a]|nr:hypothetical protein FRB94_011847 [Tulasnella sp. JGI-2019a]
MSLNSVTKTGQSARVVKRPYPESSLGVEFEAIIENFMDKFIKVVGSKTRSRLTQSARRILMADKDIAIAEDAVNKLNLRLMKLISSHRRDRNQDVAINQLPAEVLVKIFFHSLGGLYATQFSQLHMLAQVSIGWSQLIKGTPELFGFVTTNGTPEHARRMLRLSKYAPLDIQYCKDPFSTSRAAELLEALLSEAYRWRSIEMSDVLPGMVNDVFQRSTPMLRDVHIVSTGFGEQICLGPETLGRLRYLTLERATLRWDPSNLKDLKSLELCRIGAEGRISLLQLLEILRASPGIQVLRLGTESVAEAPPPPENYTPIELSQLSKISLTDLSLNTTHDLLKSVRIPNCKFFTVKCLYVPAPVPATTALFDSSTRHVEPVVRSILQSIGPISISLNPVMMLVHGTGDGVRLEVDLPMVPRSGSIAWFESMTDSLLSSASISVTIAGTPESGGPFPILRHPSISKVQIMDSFIEAGRWIAYLKAPQTTDGILAWPLPRLKRLTFDDCDIDPEDLLKMVRFRYGKEEEEDVQIFDGSGGGKRWVGWDERPDQPPASLELLDVTGSGYLDINDLEKFEEVIENFIWDNPDEEEEIIYEDEYYDDGCYSDIEYY